MICHRGTGPYGRDPLQWVASSAQLRPKDVVRCLLDKCTPNRADTRAKAPKTAVRWITGHLSREYACVARCARPEVETWNTASSPLAPQPVFGLNMGSSLVSGTPQRKAFAPSGICDNADQFFADRFSGMVEVALKTLPQLHECALRKNWTRQCCYSTFARTDRPQTGHPRTDAQDRIGPCGRIDIR